MPSEKKPEETKDNEEITLTRIASVMSEVEDRLKVARQGVEATGIGAMKPSPAQLERIWGALGNLYYSLATYETTVGIEIHKGRKLQDIK